MPEPAPSARPADSAPARLSAPDLDHAELLRKLDALASACTPGAKIALRVEAAEGEAVLSAHDGGTTYYATVPASRFSKGRVLIPDLARARQAVASLTGPQVTLATDYDSPTEVTFQSATTIRRVPARSAPPPPSSPHSTVEVDADEATDPHATATGNAEATSEEIGPLDPDTGLRAAVLHEPSSRGPLLHILELTRQGARLETAFPPGHPEQDRQALIRLADRARGLFAEDPDDPEAAALLEVGEVAAELAYQTAAEAENPEVADATGTLAATASTNSAALPIAAQLPTASPQIAAPVVAKADRAAAGSQPAPFADPAIGGPAPRTTASAPDRRPSDRVETSPRMPNAAQQEVTVSEAAVTIAEQVPAAQQPSSNRAPVSRDAQELSAALQALVQSRHFVQLSNGSPYESARAALTEMRRHWTLAATRLRSTSTGLDESGRISALTRAVEAGRAAAPYLPEIFARRCAEVIAQAEAYLPAPEASATQVEVAEAARPKDISGVQLVVEEHGESTSASERHRAALEDAYRFFREQLESDRGAPARKYLLDRRLDTLIQPDGAFTAGFAPGGNLLLRHLTSPQLGYTAEELVAAGLVKVAEERHYDAFRNRVIVPIHDTGGNLVGFAGRRIDGVKDQKWLNSAGSELYQKRQVLFGLGEQLDAITQETDLVLIEGYFDAVAVSEIDGYIGLSVNTNSLTPEQIQQLLGLPARRVLLAPDADRGGTLGMFRMYRTLREQLGVRSGNIPVITFERKDASETYEKDGAQGLLEALQAPTTPLSLLVISRQLDDLETKDSRGFDTPESKIRAIRSLLPDALLVADEDREQAQLLISELRRRVDAETSGAIVDIEIRSLRLDTDLIPADAGYAIGNEPEDLPGLPPLPSLPSAVVPSPQAASSTTDPAETEVSAAATTPQTTSFETADPAAAVAAPQQQDQSGSTPASEPATSQPMDDTQAREAVSRVVQNGRAAQQGQQTEIRVPTAQPSQGPSAQNGDAGGVWRPPPAGYTARPVTQPQVPNPPPAPNSPWTALSGALWRSVEEVEKEIAATYRDHGLSPDSRGRTRAGRPTRQAGGDPRRAMDELEFALEAARRQRNSHSPGSLEWAAIERLVPAARRLANLLEPYRERFGARRDALIGRAGTALIRLYEGVGALAERAAERVSIAGWPWDRSSTSLFEIADHAQSAARFVATTFGVNSAEPNAGDLVQGAVARPAASRQVSLQPESEAREATRQRGGASNPYRQMDDAELAVMHRQLAKSLSLQQLAAAEEATIAPVSDQAIELAARMLHPDLAAAADRVQVTASFVEAARHHGHKIAHQPLVGLDQGAAEAWAKAREQVRASTAAANPRAEQMKKFAGVTSRQLDKVSQELARRMALSPERRASEHEQRRRAREQRGGQRAVDSATHGFATVHGAAAHVATAAEQASALAGITP